MKERNEFNEARQALQTTRNELRRNHALSLLGVFAAIHACYLAIGSLYKTAFARQLPHNHYLSHPLPGRIITSLGIRSEYGGQTNQFLDKLNQYGLCDIIYEGAQACQYYKRVKSNLFAEELVEGAFRFINETEQLASNARVLDKIRLNMPTDMCWHVNPIPDEPCVECAEI